MNIPIINALMKALNLWLELKTKTLESLESRELHNAIERETRAQREYLEAADGGYHSLYTAYLLERLQLYGEIRKTLQSRMESAKPRIDPGDGGSPES